MKLFIILTKKRYSGVTLIGRRVNKGIESETEFETFKKIVEKFLPEVVVCEGWLNYEKSHGIISQRSKVLKNFNYEMVGSYSMDIAMLRLLRVYKRRKKCM